MERVHPKLNTLGWSFLLHKIPMIFAQISMVTKGKQLLTAQASSGSAWHQELSKVLYLLNIS